MTRDEIMHLANETAPRYQSWGIEAHFQLFAQRLIQIEREACANDDARGRSHNGAQHNEHRDCKHQLAYHRRKNRGPRIIIHMLAANQHAEATVVPAIAMHHVLKQSPNEAAGDQRPGEQRRRPPGRRAVVPGDLPAEHP